MNSIGKLILTSPDGQEQEFSLAQSDYTIGRAAANDIVLPDAQVSRTHAQLLCNADGCTIVDRDSANGVLVNGVPVRRALLAPGDLLVLGDSTLRYALGPDSDESAVVEIDSEAGLDETIAQATVPMALADTRLPRLVIHTTTQTWEAPLTREVLTIGRHGDNDLRLDTPKISRHHARIERTGDRFRIRDLGSTNGTWLGERRIDEHLLSSGETIRMGDVRLLFKGGFHLDDATLAGFPLAGPTRARQPVLFIPGMMGSDLWRGGERFWPNPKLLFTQPEVLQLREDDPVEARNIVGDVVIVPNLVRLQRYGRMGDFLEEALGYQRGVDLLEFAYDWRQDSRHSARRLAETIDSWPVTPPITIIAHSGGCLVARYYVEQLGGKRKVGRLILVGGPHGGSPKSVANLLSGPDFLPFGFMGDRIRQALATFPSVYQLLPAYASVFDQIGQPIDVYADRSWLPPQQRPLLQEAQAFRRELGTESSLPTTSIFGYGLKTTTEIRVQRASDGAWQSVKLEVSDAGDATIPTVSAVLAGSDIHPVQQHHGSLYVDNDVKMRLMLELTRPG